MAPRDGNSIGYSSLNTLCSKRTLKKSKCFSNALNNYFFIEFPYIIIEKNKARA